VKPHACYLVTMTHSLFCRATASDVQLHAEHTTLGIKVSSVHQSGTMPRTAALPARTQPVASACRIPVRLPLREQHKLPRSNFLADAAVLLPLSELRRQSSQRSLHSRQGCEGALALVRSAKLKLCLQLAPLSPRERDVPPASRQRRVSGTARRRVFFVAAGRRVHGCARREAPRTTSHPRVAGPRLCPRGASDVAPAVTARRAAAADGRRRVRARVAGQRGQRARQRQLAGEFRAGQLYVGKLLRQSRSCQRLVTRFFPRRSHGRLHAPTRVLG